MSVYIVYTTKEQITLVITQPSPSLSYNENTSCTSEMCTYGCVYVFSNITYIYIISIAILLI